MIYLTLLLNNKLGTGQPETGCGFFLPQPGGRGVDFFYPFFTLLTL